MRGVAALLVATLVSAGCSPSMRFPAAGPEEQMPDVAVRYYDVAGGSQAELRRQLDALGPIDETGTRRDGVTNWNVRWVPGPPVAGHCAPLAEWSHSIEIVLPRWTPPPGSDGALTARWQQFVDALRAHELAHARIVRDRLQPMKAGMEHAPCAGANATAYRALEEIRHTHRQFDRDTRNGAATGATFP